MTWKPWTFFTVAIAGWMNRQQQEAIAYLRMENRILREKLGHKRILLNESQKRRLATAAVRLPRDMLRDVCTLFSPNTLLKWNRWFIARKYDGTGHKKPGPAPTKQRMIRDIVLRMAKDNPNWGYGRMYGELKQLGYNVHWQTVRRVMKDYGLLDDPDPEPKTSWKTFLQSHWESIAACDFFTLEAWTKSGLTRFMVLFVIDLATRKVEIAGIHHAPCEEQMLQMARNLTDAEDGFLKGKRVLIHDRDPLFTQKFRETLRAAGVRSLKLPKRSPNLNSYSESWVRAAKYECFNKMIFFGEKHVRHVVENYVEHHNTERPHKGLNYNRPVESDIPLPREGPIKCRERLGGLLKSYYRDAA
jgi:transposase InsO family protein